MQTVRFMSIEPLWFDVAPVFEEWLESGRGRKVAIRVGDHRRGYRMAVAFFSRMLYLDGAAA